MQSRMYRGDDSEVVEFKFSIVWDKNTFQGFIYALILTFICLLIFANIEIELPELYQYQRMNSIPVELLSPGDGDGTGISKGNLSEKGKLHKGRDRMSDLQDAEVAGKTERSSDMSNTDDLVSSKLVARNAFASDQKTNNEEGNKPRDIGAQEGSEEGTGLTSEGSGPGAGFGLGDIEWGGGGNRRCTYKPPIPAYPSGVSARDIKVKIKFSVGSDGKVFGVRPLQKGDFMLDKLAMDWVRKLQFNPVNRDVVMEGTITVGFRLK